jgi:hypothetical protein
MSFAHSRPRESGGLGLCEVCGACRLGGRIVEVEADIGAGLPRTVLVGLPDSALYQSCDRFKAAVSNSGQEWPISLHELGIRIQLLSHRDRVALVAVSLG